MSEFGENLKNIFPKKNSKYFTSQIGGTLIGYIGALLVANLTNETNINEITESGINLVTKGSLYWLGNLGIYYLLNLDLDKKELKENMINLNNAIKAGFLTSYSLKGISYYTVLQIDSIPNNFAPLYAYPLAGMIGLMIKLKKSKDTNLFNLPSFDELKNLIETGKLELYVKTQNYMWEKTRKLEKILDST